jgi:predicted acylesterase/phospholipase RssA
MTSKTILCIDGGGTCGLFSHHILKKIALLGMWDVDLVVGVSVGAIVGALFSTGMLVNLDDATIQLYIRQLFSDESTKGPWFGPKYKGMKKSSVLHHIFGDLKFGELHVPMAILVDRIGNSPTVCRSWDPLYSEVPLMAILDATSAVPVLFPPVTINGEQYIDGGTVAGSPIGIAYLVALDIFARAQLTLISIGTVQKEQSGDVTRFDNTEMGIFQLISVGLPLKVLRQGSILVNELAKTLLGSRFIRIEGDVVARIDDVSIYTECILEADEVWSRMESSVVAFLYTASNVPSHDTPEIETGVRFHFS